MVNYKRVVCEVAVVAVLLTVAAGAPTPDCDKHYDQRQNGTENYRLNIDGVVIAVAPAQSLLEVASDIDISDLLELYEMNEMEKPKPPSNPISIPDVKPEDTKPQQSKPESPEKPAEAPLSDVSLNTDLKPAKKDALSKKHEKTQRLKARLAHILLPLLRKNRHH
ncbi:uncharacterized protein LOC131850800 [Achroia grisella]|uniref:uncharacterized protein LOC131850800 n=1 Tax=Achroia grisella TaxID=688607 RepID=UPI0027D348AA|nr:uncharacterized protein LOC131850800 [Achroia grisella]